MLTKLELQNFKSHRHTKFNFDESRLQAIVGQNSSGKTSVLQALSCLSQLSELRLRDFSEYQKEISELITSIGEGNTTIGFNNIVINGDGENWYFSCELYKDKIWHKKRAWKVDDRELTDGNIVKAITMDGFLWSNVIDNFLWSNELDFISYLKLAVANLSRAAYSEEIVPEIEFDGSGLAPTLDYLRNEYPEQFQSLQIMLQQIVPSVRRIGTRRAKVDLDRQRLIEVDGQSIVIDDNQEVIGQEIVMDMATGDRIPASAISEGTMLTLGLLTVLVNPQQPNLVLLDDIEQGLHPKAQRELMTVFKQIIEANPNLQIIFTTHSPYIIDELEPAQVHVLSNSKDGFTHVKRLDQHPDIEWAKQSLTTGEFWDAEGEDWVIEADDEND